MKNCPQISSLIFAAALLLGGSVTMGQENGIPQEPSLEQSLNQYQGEVVLLDFWASWCGPCRRSFPWMNDMQTKYSEGGLRVVAVNLDQEPADAAKFLLRYPANFTIWYDPTGKLAKRYDVQAMPTSLLIGRQGKVLSVHRGFRTKQIEAYEQAIKQAL